MVRSLRGGGRIAALAAVVLIVASACSKDSTPAAPIYDVFAQQFKFHGMPESIPSGNFQINFSNKESFPITHEMIPIALPAGKTAQDVIDAAKADGAASEDDWLHIGGDFGAVDTGAGIVEILNLPPGTYAFACWQTGTQSGTDDGPPHAAKGMVTSFTVS